MVLPSNERYLLLNIISPEPYQELPAALLVFLLVLVEKYTLKLKGGVSCFGKICIVCTDH